MAKKSRHFLIINVFNSVVLGRIEADTDEAAMKIAHKISGIRKYINSDVWAFREV